MKYFKDVCYVIFVILLLGVAKMQKQLFSTIVIIVQKNLCKLTECLPLLQVAHRNAQQYPSVADNPNNDMNVAKYTLSKVLNQTSKLCKHS